MTPTVHILLCTYSGTLLYTSKPGYDTWCMGMLLVKTFNSLSSCMINVLAEWLHGYTVLSHTHPSFHSTAVPPPGGAAGGQVTSTQDVTHASGKGIEYNDLLLL